MTQTGTGGVTQTGTGAATQTGTAVVVGADGFLGRATVRALELGGVPVTQFTRQRSFLAVGAPPVADADTIFWLVSSIRPATASAGSATADLEAARTLLDLLDTPGARGRRRVVVVSSGGTVYDPTGRPPHSERSPVAPVNAYGAAMLALEELVRTRAPQCTVLRVANAYGAGQPARRGQGVLAHWLDRIAAGEGITVIGGDHLARDYVHVDDVARALVAVHHARAAPDLLNVGSGTGTSLGELVDLVRATVAPAEVRVQHEPAREFDAPSTWLDVSRAAQELGWRPRTTLAAGLAATWDAVRAGS